MEAFLGPEQWPPGLCVSERAAGGCGRDVGLWGGRGDACSQDKHRSLLDLLEHICSCLQDILTHS